METITEILYGILIAGITLFVLFVVLPYLVGVAVAMFKRARDKFY